MLRILRRTTAVSAWQRSDYAVVSRSMATDTNPLFYPKKGDRVIVGMSGGVDSSVAARLLAEQDYDLSAVYMRNWDTRDESGTDRGCEWEKDWEDVQSVCRHIGLPCELIDLSQDYWNRVFEPSLRMWEDGKTPNPDVFCNREVKFGALFDRLVAGKANWLATGHYAGVKLFESQGDKFRPRLVRALDTTKDQTYYLSAVRESSLRRAVFPLQNIKKEEVRNLARKYQLPTAERAESMGICFVGEKKNFDDFLSDYIPSRPGDIIDLRSGAVIGEHEGLWRYTIGQGARIGGRPERMFVARKVLPTNELHLVPGSRHEMLFCISLRVKKFFWTWRDELPNSLSTPNGYRALVQVRHRGQAEPCTVRLLPTGELEITFDEPELAVAQGQIAALYEGKVCLGSGIISHTTYKGQDDFHYS